MKNIIKLYSDNIYIGNVLFDRKEIIIFKHIKLKKVNYYFIYIITYLFLKKVNINLK